MRDLCSTDSAGHRAWFNTWKKDMLWHVFVVSRGPGECNTHKKEVQILLEQCQMLIVTKWKQKYHPVALMIRIVQGDNL